MSVLVDRQSAVVHDPTTVSDPSARATDRGKPVRELRREIQDKRKGIWEYCDVHVPEWAGDRGVRLPIVPQHRDQASHMFCILMPSLEERQRLIAHPRTRNIGVFHCPPLHLSATGRPFGGLDGDGPVAEDMSDRLLGLPFYNDPRHRDLDRIVDAVREFS